MATHKEISYPGGSRRRAVAPAADVVCSHLLEDEWRESMIAYATANGFMHYHTHRSEHSPAGFPDDVFVRDQRLIFVEAKSLRGQPSKAQVRWLLALARVPGVEAYLWDPSDDLTMRRVLG